MAITPVLRSIISHEFLKEYLIDQYNLSEGCTCSLFRTGMNHTYFVTDSEVKYALRVYSYKWRSKSEITEELNLLNLLKKNNLGVSFPIKDKHGEFIQEINAPEGNRYMVLFSFAHGDKIRFIDTKTCFSIGSLMSQIHNITIDKSIDRISYNKKSLIELPLKKLKKFFSEKLPEMEYLKKIGGFFENSDFENISKGIVHLDIWYDNMAIKNDEEITIFDFDFCGNGSHVLDIGYFCKQLFFIESDKNQYESKVQSFLKGYQKNRLLSDREIKLIPKAGASVYLFYLGVQAQRFDWSNIFLTENYLKMYVGRIKAWIDYHE